MTILLENLSNADVHRLVKPQILSVFGDVALAVGAEFKRYLDMVMQTLMQASQAQVDRVSQREGKEGESNFRKRGEGERERERD